MTVDEALKLPAGIELDCLVATKVMGWTPAYGFDHHEWIGPDGETIIDDWNEWSPSFRWSDALIVLDQMKHFDFYAEAEFRQDGLYAAMIKTPDEIKHRVTSPSLPLAACRAALTALTAAGHINWENP